jgi:hypothetical protein
VLCSLRVRAGERKLRLYGCGSCHLIWHWLDRRGRDAVEVAERHADGKASHEELATARAAVSAASARPSARRSPAYAEAAARATWVTLPPLALRLSPPRFAVGKRRGDRAALVRLLRDLFGNLADPPVTIQPAWLSWNDGVVQRLAGEAYDRRTPSGELDPGCLAVLADALTEAGAASRLIEPLRRPGRRFRGLWSLDLLLGKH